RVRVGVTDRGVPARDPGGHGGRAAHGADRGRRNPRPGARRRGRLPRSAARFRAARRPHPPVAGRRAAARGHRSARARARTARVRHRGGGCERARRDRWRARALAHGRRNRGVACAGARARRSLLTGGLQPVADGLARLLLGADPPSRSLRLSAQLVLAGLLLAIPGWFALRDVLAGESQSLIEQLSLGSGLLGYVLLALASVGFLVRRDVRATLDRLGLKPLTLKDSAALVLGVAGLLAFNYSADWFQRHALPELWKRDQDFNQALAGGLSGVQAVLLGMSAGIGEEITMRGALQPRLGLALTALL